MGLQDIDEVFAEIHAIPVLNVVHEFVEMIRTEVHFERVTEWDKEGSLLTFVVISRSFDQILHLTCLKIDNVEKSLAGTGDEREVFRVEEGQRLEPVF